MVGECNISSDELRNVIEGVASELEEHCVGLHVHECPSCLSRLEEMAAERSFWTKAASILRDQRFDASSHRAIEAFEDSSHDVRTANATSGFSLAGLLDPPSHPEMIGSIGGHDVECEIGRGGMGVVLKCYDSQLRRPVAIKILGPQYADAGTARQRFVREARAAAAVLHPNVISIHGVGETKKTPYIVMPYVAGPSLQEFVERNGPLAEKDIVRIAIQVSAGLAAAHSQGLVHRDIKPANILIEPGVSRVVITDFGLARAADDVAMTQTGWLTGTPNYMSPEQAGGNSIDHRSDLFSLGCVLYFLATGHPPFRAESPLAVLSRVQRDAPAPIRQVNPDISNALAKIVELLLAKDPRRRFRSAAELHQLLEQFLAHLHQPEFSKPPAFKSIYQSGHRTWRRRATIIAFAALAALAAWGALSHGFLGSSDVVKSNTEPESGSRAPIPPPPPPSGPPPSLVGEGKAAEVEIVHEIKDVVLVGADRVTFVMDRKIRIGEKIVISHFGARESIELEREADSVVTFLSPGEYTFALISADAIELSGQFKVIEGQPTKVVLDNSARS